MLDPQQITCPDCLKKSAAKPPDEDHLTHSFDKNAARGKNSVITVQWVCGNCGARHILYWFDTAMGRIGAHGHDAF